ncbi:MAG TPA: hypothetical protein VKR56_01470 [Candidatus Cybelea sp.]|nr:hypothetical protein [Candidatus Cybelea sp.]
MSSRLSLLAVAAAAALTTMASAGCGQSTGLSVPSNVANASGSRVTPQGDKAGRSWMSPEAKKSDLLYLDDQTGNVYVYSYPKGELMGTLTGLPDPQGECVDRKGDVFFTTFGGEEILEYAHGGTSPINTLSNPGEYMEGCSVDKKTGDLAVIDFEPTTGGGGASVAIFANASGSPTILSDANLYLGYQIGYDSKGNIFVDGVDSSRNFEFAELPKGSSSFTEITLDVAITTPGGVQWDGKYVTVGDAKNGNIYQTDGAGGTVEGTTSLSDSDGIFQYFIDGKRVVGPNAYSANAGIWKYPKGGSPTVTLTGLTDPFGAAVSKAPK